MATHKHWEGAHPRYGLAPVCRFHTIKACDTNRTQFEHGHLGVDCVKEIQESKTKRGQPTKIATCTIVVRPEHGMSFDLALQEQMAQAPDSWWEGLWSWQRLHAETLTVRPLRA